MTESSAESATTAETLNRLLSESGLPPLDPATSAKFADYLALILRWNARTNLTSIRNPDDILRRHFVESIACARALPAINSLLDFGSGAGLPGIPIALSRPEITVTLAESQNKKAAFLREAVRTLQLSAQVFGGRAENIDQAFDCVTLRAVDRMDLAIPAAAKLLRPNGWLAVMTTSDNLGRAPKRVNADFVWADPLPLLGAKARILTLGRRIGPVSEL